MGNYTIFKMFENSRRSRQAGNFTTNSRSQIVRTDMFQKLSLGAPESSWLDVRPQFHATQSFLHEYHLADLGD